MTKEILRQISFWRIIVKQILIQVHRVVNRNLKIHMAEEDQEEEEVQDNKLIVNNNEQIDYRITYCYYMGIFCAFK